MLFLTRWFGVTATDADRNLDREKAEIEEITELSLLLQENSAAKQNRPLGRGTHVKGVSVRGQFEVFDVTAGRDHGLGVRLAKGMFAKRGVYPAIVRFANSDPSNDSDFKADVRSMSFSVDLTREGRAVFGADIGRQDFSLQNTTTLPINDASAFLALVKVLSAPDPLAALWHLSFKDKLRVSRTLTLVQFQLHQAIKPYQQLRYGSNVPFCHGPIDVVKYSASPSSDNPAGRLERKKPNGLQDELIRHVQADSKMSSFDFGVQFLDTKRMTYWGKPRDPNFWIENASVEWHDAEAPFHTVGRLTLLAKSHLQQEAAHATYIDVTGNSTPDSRPLGSINRARWHAEVASRKARMEAASNRVSDRSSYLRSA
jgi:hypothetical protein